MAAEYAIREIDPVATDEILDLVRLGLGAGSVPRTSEFWNWKHVHNPFGPSYALAAEADGRLVGLRMFLRWRFRCGDREIPAVRAVDTVTHPDWQGRGIFKNLTLAMLERVAKDGVAFVFNTPNKKSRAGYLKMGWQDVGRVPVSVRPLRPLRIVFRINGTKVKSPAIPGSMPVGDLLTVEPNLFNCFRVADRSRDSGRARLQTPRSISFLRWRYDDIPGIEYRAAALGEGNHTTVILLRHRDRRGRRELRLADVLGSNTSRSITSELLSEFARRASSADYVVLTGGSSISGWSALQAGFCSLPFGTPWFVVRPFLATTPDPTRWSSWNLAAGDLELF